MRQEPIEAARNFIIKYFPDCQGAVLAGSVIRGESTETSDLDIVVFCKEISSAYRESLIAFGWPIEIFVHNLTYIEIILKVIVKERDLHCLEWFQRD
jgi:predicted nucleotidyltransferase